jgi:hypothetical protein
LAHQSPSLPIHDREVAPGDAVAARWRRGGGAVAVRWRRSGGAVAARRRRARGRWEAGGRRAEGWQGRRTHVQRTRKRVSAVAWPLDAQDA